MTILKTQETMLREDQGRQNNSVDFYEKQEIEATSEAMKVPRQLCFHERKRRLLLYKLTLGQWNIRPS